MRSFNQPYRLRGHIVTPRSTANIRQVAANTREVLNLPDRPPPLDNFLESLSEFGITVDVLDDHDFPIPGVEAMCVPETATIALKDSTYRLARRNDPRTRFTVFHELGHFILGHTKALGRGRVEPKPFLDSEWQADQFAAEMTMPLPVIHAQGLNTPQRIAQFFGVSLPAATHRHNQVAKL